MPASINACLFSNRTSFCASLISEESYEYPFPLNPEPAYRASPLFTFSLKSSDNFLRSVGIFSDCPASIIALTTMGANFSSSTELTNVKDMPLLLARPVRPTL